MKYRITIFLIVLSLFIGFSLPTFANSAYDWQSGNQYYWYKDSNGTTNLRGYNFNTGSNWSTKIEPNGDMSGFDSNTNYWRYYNNTGSYWNSNGHGCIGKGLTRTCW